MTRAALALLVLAGVSCARSGEPAALEPAKPSALADRCRALGGTVAGESCTNLPQPTVSWSEVRENPAEECARKGGAWRTFLSTCVDGCSPTARRVCGAAETPGCDCGETRCTVRNERQETCVDNPAWHHAF